TYMLLQNSAALTIPWPTTPPVCDAAESSPASHCQTILGEPSRTSYFVYWCQPFPTYMKPSSTSGVNNCRPGGRVSGMRYARTTRRRFAALLRLIWFRGDE